MTAREVEHAGSAKVKHSIPAAGTEVKRGRTSPVAAVRRMSLPTWRMSPRRWARRAGR
jgi:hypothetical protein